MPTVDQVLKAMAALLVEKCTLAEQLAAATAERDEWKLKAAAAGVERDAAAAALADATKDANVCFKAPTG